MATDPLTLARETDFALVPSQGVEIPNFHELMASLREETPLAEVLFAGQPSWLVTRYPDVLHIFRDEAHFSSRLLHEANSFPVMGRNVMGLEGEEHRAHRELAKPPLRYRYVMDHYVQPMLRPLCNRLV